MPDKTDEQLWRDLYAIDPDRAAQIHIHDRYRVERALNIWETTGKKPSEQVPEYMPLETCVRIICVTREREELYERINSRVDKMMHEGWLEEVKKLRGTDWERFLYEKKLIGYDDLLDYLSGAAEFEDILASIKTKSRHLRKATIVFLAHVKLFIIFCQSRQKQKNKHNNSRQLT